MRKNLLIFTLGSILWFCGAAAALGATNPEEPPPCEGSVPGFLHRGAPGAATPQSGRSEATGSATARSGPRTIKGGINTGPADLTFDSKRTTVTGGVNGSPVDLQMDPASGRITGGANGSKVDLTVRSNAECTLTTGGANGSPVAIRVDWETGLLSGYSNHSPVRVEFREKKGTQGTVVTLEGYANHAPVELVYDRPAGRLTGGLGNAKVDLTFKNVTLQTFIDYFFLFLEP